MTLLCKMFNEMQSYGSSNLTECLITRIQLDTVKQLGYSGLSTMGLENDMPVNDP